MTAVVMGPYATQMLGDFGADVIKVESPAGDDMRHIGPMRNDAMGHIYLNLNRNKRSLVLDLKRDLGRRALLKVVAGCDVLVYNIRPRAMQRLGLDFETLHALNPRLIYVGAVGYGSGGPYAGKPAYDDLIQGATGIASLMEQSGSHQPRYAPVLVADRSVGQLVALAVCAALFRRSVTGVGQSIEVPMFEGLAQFVLGEHLAGETFVPPLGPAGYPRLLTEHRKPYRTRDGYVCALIYTDRHWASFFEAIDRPDLAADARFSSYPARTARIAEIYAFVALLMTERSSEEWLALFERADIPAMPLHSVQSLIEDPHLAATGFFRSTQHPSEGELRVMQPPGTWSESPPAVTRHAPRLGEHSLEVLREAGVSEADIGELVASGATTG
jgi:crotonobetainyl-CoA:carnitine CoA-transferase CaiB-like acyl-CoA transferase